MRELSELKAEDLRVRVDPNYSEQKDYGDGWKLSKKIFEIGSQISIAKADAAAGNMTLGPRFHEATFMHLLLNECGYSVHGEALLHLVIVGERIAVHFCGGDMNLVDKKF